MPEDCTCYKALPVDCPVETHKTPYCPKCGEYVPMLLNETARAEHDCGRMTPESGLPLGVCVCPCCGSYGIGRLACYGPPEHEHEHAFRLPPHELVGDKHASSSEVSLHNALLEINSDWSDWGEAEALKRVLKIADEALAGRPNYPLGIVEDRG